MKPRIVLSQRMLQAVRGRLQVEDNEADSSRDAEILAFPARKLVRLYFGWHFGDESLADDAIRRIEEAYGITLREPQ